MHEKNVPLSNSRRGLGTFHRIGILILAASTLWIMWAQAAVDSPYCVDYLMEGPVDCTDSWPAVVGTVLVSVLALGLILIDARRAGIQRWVVVSVLSAIVLICLVSLAFIHIDYVLYLINGDF